VWEELTGEMSQRRLGRVGKGWQNGTEGVEALGEQRLGHPSHRDSELLGSISYLLLQKQITPKFRGLKSFKRSSPRIVSVVQDLGPT
jgi:hypothetical protein